MATTPSWRLANFGNGIPGLKKEDRVRTIFSEIAPRYDLLNHVLSFNVDRRWRRQAVRMLGWRDHESGRYLDACAGTFDLSLALVGEPDFVGSVVATDFALPMLLEGRDKLRGSISTVCGDTLSLPFADGCFDGATVGFGVRNLADLSGGFSALARVVRPGARLVVLEFTLPPNPVLRALYNFYFHRILPVIGRLVSGHPWAYTYLPESVKEFPPPSELADIMRESGFKDVEWRFLTGGIAAIHVGVRA